MIHGGFYGGLLLNRLGGYTRYIFGTAIRKLGLSGSRYYSLREYLHGAEREEDSHWDKGPSHEMANKVVGMISLGVLIWLVYFIEQLVHFAAF